MSVLLNLANLTIFTGGADLFALEERSWNT